MSKIICDLCGTSYPETESQCPLCGTAKTDVSKKQESTADNYAYVRGGRFSKENVRKRNAGADKPAQAPAAPKQQPKQQPPTRETRETQEKAPSNTGLIIVVVILLLAIISVCAYIAIRFIDLNNSRGNTESTQGTAAKPQEILCTGVTLSQTELEFTSVNKTILLQPILQPSDTTQQVFFSSSNENVVTVDTSGLVTPVADGEAIIYVRCGGFQAECKVVCSIGIEPPQPTDPNPPETDPTGPSGTVDPTDPPAPGVELELNREDFTLNGYGASWNLANRGQGYVGPDASEVTWTSDDPTVATVENGVVTAVGNGKTVIRAEYQGVVASCIVRCNNVTVPEDPTYVLSHTDATIAIGEQFSLSLLSAADSAKVNGVTYQVVDPEICSVSEKGRVEGLSAGMTTIIVEYEGVRYECIVRVKEAPPEN